MKNIERLQRGEKLKCREKLLRKSDKWILQEGKNTILSYRLPIACSVFILIFVFGNRFLRKVPDQPGKWEDAGDAVAKEKASQVLRDAIQRRKHNAKKVVRKDGSLSAQSKKKRPPKKVKVAPKKRSSQPDLPKVPAPQWRSNTSLPFTQRSSHHDYSPISSEPRPFYSYGRLPYTDPRYSTQNIPVPTFQTTLPPHQYPVTPSNSSIAVSTAKKRQRFSHESPLTEGYHHYPYPTPIRSAKAEKSSLAPTSYSTPFNPNIRGHPFSSPTSKQNSDENLSSLRHVSTFHTAQKKHPAYDIVQSPPPLREKSKAHPADEKGTHQDLALLLSHDVLSDSDSKNDSSQLFPSDDLIF